MNKVTLFSIILGVAIGAAPVRAESIPLRPGEYQVTAVTETSNGEAGKPDSHTRCMKEEHLAHPDAIFNYDKLNGFKPKPSNKVTNVSIHDGKVSYDIEGPHAMTRVEGTVSNASFSVLRKATPMAGNGVLITMRVEGKRTGDCPSK